MNYFVLESVFQKPFEEFGDVVSSHRAYLQTWYEKGILLCSGPKSDKSGGIIIGKAETLAEIENIVNGDPYCKLGFANYTIKQFNPAKKSQILDNWL